MPDFSAHRKRRPSPHKPGSLTHDLHETKQDIRAAKRGEETEASLTEMRETKRRIRREIRDEVMKERGAKLRELDPLQVPREKPKPSPAIATKFRAPAAIAAARG